jgi:hypothetical protein
MRVEKLFESRFIRAADLNGKPWTGTMAALRTEKLEGNTGPRLKGIIKFSEWPDKEFVTNRTNLSLIAAMFGPETDNWIGKRITIHPVIWQGEELCLRVKGSPDIPATMTTTLKLPRKSPVQIQLQKTAKAGASGRAAPNAANGTPTEAEQVLDQARQANEERTSGDEG